MKPLYGYITALIPLKHTVEVRLEDGRTIYFKLHRSESMHDLYVGRPFCGVES